MSTKYNLGNVLAHKQLIHSPAVFPQKDLPVISHFKHKAEIKFHGLLPLIPFSVCKPDSKSVTILANHNYVHQDLLQYKVPNALGQQQCHILQLKKIAQLKSSFLRAQRDNGTTNEMSPTFKPFPVQMRFFLGFFSIKAAALRGI